MDHVRESGVVCLTGIVGNKGSLGKCQSDELIPVAVWLTAYSGNEKDFAQTPLDELAQKVTSGKMDVQIWRVSQPDDVVDAHKPIDSIKTGDKIVVLN